MTRIRAYFALKGDCDPEEATRVLGVVPTRTWRCGEPLLPGASAKKACDGWEVGTEEEEGFDLPRHVEVVLGQLSGLTEEINSLSERLVLHLDNGVST